MICTCNSVEETVALGAKLGASLRVGDLLDLRGPLGAGKTVLVRGIASGAGADSEKVRSPTFVLHQIYPGRIPLHHIDLYRLGQAANIEEFDFEELLQKGAVLVEWGNYAQLQGLASLIVEIESAAAASQRQITLSGSGLSRFAQLLTSA